MNNWLVRNAWTDERRQMAFDLWKEGLSARQISIRIGGVSRNAVIGVVHRAGLSERPTASKPRKPASVPRATRRLTTIAMTPAVMHVLPSDAAPIKPLPKRDYKPGAHACALDDLGAHQCRWPLGPLLEPSHLFCGEPLDEDRDRNVPPYCEEHQQRSISRQAKKSDGRRLEKALRRYFVEKVAA